MANRKERIYMFDLAELLISIPEPRNNADIKSISEFRHEMVFITGKVSYALRMLTEGSFETIDEIIIEVKEYLKSREILWNEEKV